MAQNTPSRHYKNQLVNLVRRIASIYQPTNAHIISHKTLLKHFKTLWHVSILSDHHHAVLFLAEVMLQYSQFNWYLQTRCCGSISCCGVVLWCAVHMEQMLHYAHKFVREQRIKTPWNPRHRRVQMTEADHKVHDVMAWIGKILLKTQVCRRGPFVYTETTLLAP